MKLPRLLLLVVAPFCAGSPARANVIPAALFCDHAVLQQGGSIPVWGTADAGEKVTVELDGHRQSATAAQDGRWLIRLPAPRAGGPYTLTIAGRNRVVLHDILVGEVWICSGQSNMERQLGLREGQKPLLNWQAEVAAANYPEIRHFGVAQKLSLTPVSDVEGQWAVCSPETVANFTAVGFFFARALYQARHVPIGLIHSSWGGTPAESWTSADALAKRADFAESIALIRSAATNRPALEAAYAKSLDQWFAANDVGAKTAAPWSAEQVDTSAWRTMTLPTFWEKAGLPDFDGLVWFRRDFDLPAAWAGKSVMLHLGAIDDVDTTWVNGRAVGTTNNWQKLRVYELPAGLLKPGRNSIAVRVLDTGGGGGLYGGGDALRLVRRDDPAAVLSLAGEWRYRVSTDFAHTVPPPSNFLDNPGAPSSLYNAMIAPLQPYAMRGVIWYQGEANSPRARQYRTLFPEMVADWRQHWGEGDFPFLYVQIAPFREMLPEIREAQLLALDRIPRSAMAVTLDIGDAEDIHPANKRPVGERLALAARALAYGEKLEYSGPLYRGMAVKGHEIVLSFDHEGTGLVAPGGELHGFTIAGADQVFHPANAVISGGTVVVSSNEVQAPTAVRYAWANAPEGNLFNRDGLPASPFRTDVD